MLYNIKYKVRCARETPVKREVRLQQMKTHGRRRACEMPEDREARLQQTSDDRGRLDLKINYFSDPNSVHEVEDVKVPCRFGVY